MCGIGIFGKNFLFLAIVKELLVSNGKLFRELFFFIVSYKNLGNWKLLLVFMAI